MGNSLKLVKWIGIGAVVLIVVAIGMAVMKGFDSFIDEDSDKLIIIDNNELKNKLAPYTGMINGTKVRQMCNFMAQNAEENENDFRMLPDLAYQATGGEDFKIIESVKGDSKASTIKTAGTKFDAKHNYMVELVENKQGRVTGVIVKYNEEVEYTFEPSDT